jgi:phosphoribosylpyrophosphate synthetase
VLGLSGYASDECVRTRDFCVIVDDIVASGETLRAAVSCVKNMGAKHVIAIVTHTVIAPDEQLLDSIDAWITTNTFDTKLDVITVDIAPFVVAEIAKIRTCLHDPF